MLQTIPHCEIIAALYSNVNIDDEKKIRGDSLNIVLSRPMLLTQSEIILRTVCSQNIFFISVCGSIGNECVVDFYSILMDTLAITCIYFDEIME